MVAEKVLQFLMKTIKVLPHEVICPEGLEIQAYEGETILDACLRNGIKIEHACEKSCACTTCHVVIREGFQELDSASDDEEDLLDKAWGLEATSRLSCQVVPEADQTTIELPKYTINQVSELT